MKKRLLSLLLSLCMVLCLLPTAYADSENYWTNFRNSPYNMAITDAPTPTSAETTVEKWAKSFGSAKQPQRLCHRRQLPHFYESVLPEKGGSADR